MRTELIEEIKSLRRQLHEIPELAFQEYKTKELLMSYLRQFPELDVVDRGAWFYVKYEKCENITSPTAGYGDPSRSAFAEELATTSPSAIAFRADFDGVAGRCGLPGHYCGHDGHAAILAGLGRMISEQKPDRTIYLIFQPAEEIGEGAKLCRELLREQPIGEIYGFHNIPGAPLGTVLVRDGTFACGSTGLEIKVTGTPSHAAYPEAGKNPAEVISKLILAKEKLLEPYEGLAQATVIGVDLGSSAYGVSASEGTLRLTLRAEFNEEYEQLVESYIRLAMQLADASGMQCSVRKIEEFPATTNHKACIRKVEEAAMALNMRIQRPGEPFRWSEDFGYYLKENPGAFFGVGDGEEWPQLHTEAYEFPDKIIETMIKLYMRILEET